jgi:hypothetical protein
METKIIEKYNFPQILNLEFNEENLRDFVNQFTSKVDKDIAFAWWKAQFQCRPMWSPFMSSVKSGTEFNFIKREYTRFIYTNCHAIDSGITTKLDDIITLSEDKAWGIKWNDKGKTMMNDHWTSPQTIGEYFLDQLLDSTLDGKRYLDDISKFFEYCNISYLCITVPKKLNDKLSAHSPISNNKKITKLITEKKYDILEIPLYHNYGAELSTDFRNNFFTAPEGMTNWEIVKYNAKSTLSHTHTLF